MSQLPWPTETRPARVPTVVVVHDVGTTIPEPVTRWIASLGAVVDEVSSTDALMARLLRSRPTAVVVDAAAPRMSRAVDALARAKADSFTSVIPAIAVADDAVAVAPLLGAGADDVILIDSDPSEAAARLTALLRRSTRDTGVHPTTRLPGTNEIEAQLERRIAEGAPFATCYADLDHFKEFNDRYGYNEGDRVIRMVALILHDVVVGVCGERGFVGHIGGDDFIFVVPLDAMVESCSLIVETFDSLVPFQYSDADRRAGYYFGKDRRGQLHRVPLMSLSIGVVTNERRTFTRASQVSALASEMKSYAKAQSGSGYSVDRRNEPPPEPPRTTAR